MSARVDALAEFGFFLPRLLLRVIKFFSRRSVQRMPRQIYPRLELPPIDLVFEYHMSHPKRGIAMIFNHEHFVHNPQRKGTGKDRQRLKETFEQLAFEVKIFDDLSFVRICEKLDIVAQMDHSNNDCLAITILTHGSYGTLSSRDSDYYIEQITSRFTDDKCPTLAGKPRLFFIQACRGDYLDRGVVVKNALFKYTVNRSPFAGNDFVDQPDTGPFIHISDGNDQVHNPPNHQEFLIVRSTMPKFAAFRHTENGSWFIQALCNELSANGTSEDIMSLLTHVNWSVSEHEAEAVGNKQVLCISSMLTKILIFNVKDNLQDNLANATSDQTS